MELEGHNRVACCAAAMIAEDDVSLIRPMGCALTNTVAHQKDRIVADAVPRYLTRLVLTRPACGGRSIQVSRRD
jgi:hypothetical protein